MSVLRKRLIALLDKIEDLFQNNAKIQSELIQILFELEHPKPDIEDILGIKVYLGSDYKAERTFGKAEENIKIGEEIPNPFLEQSEPSVERSEPSVSEDPFAGCNGPPPPKSLDISVSGSVVVPKVRQNLTLQDCAGNLLTLSPEDLEDRFIHSTSELWK